MKGLYLSEHPSWQNEWTDDALAKQFLRAIELLNSNETFLYFLKHCDRSWIILCRVEYRKFPLFSVSKIIHPRWANWQINFGSDRQFEFNWRPIVIWWSWQKWFSGQFNSSIFITVYRWCSSWENGQAVENGGQSKNTTFFFLSKFRWNINVRLLHIGLITHF